MILESALILIVVVDGRAVLQNYYSTAATDENYYSTAATFEKAKSPIHNHKLLHGSIKLDSASKCRSEVRKK